MKKKPGKRTLAICVVLVGLAFILAANAHLVYVALISDPDCIVANSDIEPTDKIYRPVKSGC